MNITKKLFALMLTFVMVFAYFALPVLAEESESESKGETFSISFIKPTGATVTLSPSGEHTTVENSETYIYEKGTSVNVTIAAESGYDLTSIKASGLSIPVTKNEICFACENDTNIIITTEEKIVQKAHISVNSSSLFTYTLEGADENNIAEVGSNVVLKITPEDGCSITSITYNNMGVGSSSEYSFTVEEINVFIISVSAPEKLELSVSVEGSGNVTPQNGSFEKGSAVELKFAPNAGYFLSSVNINGKDIPLSEISGNKYSFTIEEDTEVNVVFKKSITITATIGKGGTISINGKNISKSTIAKVAEGSDVTIRVSPSLGYKISSVKVDGKTVSLDNQNTYTISSVDSSKRLSVSFTTSSPGTKQYSINASAGQGGSISPSGSNVVEQGKSIVFTVTPDSGYEVDTVKVDGKSVSLLNYTYTFKNVAASQNIYVSFKQTETANNEDSPICIEDINWDSSDTIIIDISEKTKVAAKVFQKITDDCKEKTIVFAADKYQWTLPQGMDVSITSEYSDLELTKNGSNYEDVANYINTKAENIKFFLFSYENNFSFPAGTKLDIEMGNIFAGSEVQQLIYDINNKELSNPKNESGNTEFDVRTVTEEGWVSIEYYNDRNIVLCDVLEPYYTITSSASEGGTINPLGKKSVQTSNDARFAITADEGYVISSLLIDDEEEEDALGQTNYEKLFSAVSEDHTISVTFMMTEDYENSVDASGSNSGLIVSLIIISLAAAGAAVLFIIKWRQEKY